MSASTPWERTAAKEYADWVASLPEKQREDLERQGLHKFSGGHSVGQRRAVGVDELEETRVRVRQRIFKPDAVPKALAWVLEAVNHDGRSKRYVAFIYSLLGPSAFHTPQGVPCGSIEEILKHYDVPSSTFNLYHKHLSRLGLRWSPSAVDAPWRPPMPGEETQTDAQE